MSECVSLQFDFIVRSGEFKREYRIGGRQAWALHELVRMGQKGCSYADNPAPRWPAYIHKLRVLGIEIETRKEKNRGLFPGFHARYVLKSQVSISNSRGADGAQFAKAS